jgi:hypothetical protein
VNGTVEEFNKILENSLTNICNVNMDDSDLKVLVVIGTYRTTCKKLRGHKTFILVYVQEVVVPLDYLIPSLCIVAITDMERRHNHNWFASGGT